MGSELSCLTNGSLSDVVDVTAYNAKVWLQLVVAFVCCE